VLLFHAYIKKKHFFSFLRHSLSGSGSASHPKHLNSPPVFGRVRSCCLWSSIANIHILSSMVRCLLQFLCKNNIRFVCTAICFVGDSYYIYFIYIYLRILVSNTIFISNDVRVIFNSNTRKGPEFTPNL
jgi:hypothetical protein